MSEKLYGPATARREFLKTAAIAGVGFFIADRSVAAADAPAASSSPAGKINVGFVGVTNQGNFDLTETSNVPNVNVAALCDVDDNRLGEAARKFPGARKFSDWRRLLDDSHDLDAIVIAIPDHHHALVTMGALQLHKHVYCEKPLTHTVREARLVAKTAVANKCVTQMGTQIHAGANYRRAVEIIQAGVIGEVTEAHVWCNTQWTADEPPTDAPPIPAGLHYDIWLGPADYRPYSPAYLPANWRRWWAFGSGTLGDMGCHYQDLAFWALGLRHPTKISAEGPPVHKEGTPAWLIVSYEYPARGQHPPAKLVWYDGGKRPAQFGDWGLNKDWGSGVMFVGDKGMLFSDYGQHHLYPKEKFAGFVPPPQTIPDSIGHHREWIEAIKTGNPLATTCNFDYAGALTEAVLLGNVAYRTGKAIEWDAEKLEVKDSPEANFLLDGHYRGGWAI